MNWLAKLHAKQAAKKAAREAVAPTLKWDYVDRPPGWVDEGQTFTTVFPAGLAPDPAIVAAIRRFCPDYVPLWSVWTFRPSWEDARQERVSFGRHVIARRVLNPKFTTHEFPGLPPGVANYMEKMLVGPSERAGETELPGCFVPLDWAMVERLRQEYGCFSNLSPAAYARKLVMSPLEAKRRVATQRALERMGAQAEVQAYFQKQIDEMSEVDMKNYALFGPRERATKLFLDSSSRPTNPTLPPTGA